MRGEAPSGQVGRPTAVSSSGFAVALAENALRNLQRWCLAVARPPRASVPQLPAGVIVAIMITVAAVIASMFLIDAAADEWARHLPQWFTEPFEQITNLGLSGWFLIPFGIIVIGLAAVISPALSRLSRGALLALALRFGFLFLAIGVPSLFDTIVKRMIGRARPFVGSHDDPFAYMPFIWRPDYASMPSGHATTAAAAAIAIGAIWPRARGVMWLYALLIMFSRVVVLAHHPSDVIAGGLVGALGAVLVRRWFAARRLLFTASDLRVYPGPPFVRIKAALREVVLGGAKARSPS
jgi:membrane-associated phospholipid phosphatase